MPTMNEIKQLEGVKGEMRRYFVDFLRKNGKGVSNEEFELLSKFENYIVERMDSKTNG
jgi:hypothetical protein